MSAIPGRNDPCPCGSGQKFKKCCIEKHRAKKSFTASVLGKDNSLFSKMKQMMPVKKAEPQAHEHKHEHGAHCGCGHSHEEKTK